jgi:hypothetical protein
MNQQNPLTIEQKSIAEPSKQEEEGKNNKELLSPKAGTATSSPNDRATSRSDKYC